MGHRIRLADVVDNLVVATAVHTLVVADVDHSHLVEADTHLLVLAGHTGLVVENRTGWAAALHSLVRLEKLHSSRLLYRMMNRLPPIAA